MQKELILSDKELTSFRSILDDKEDVLDDEQIEKVQELRKFIYEDTIKFSKLYIISYFSLRDNLYLFNEDSDLKKKVKEIVPFLETLVFTERLRFCLEYIGDGSNFGSYYKEEEIRKIVVTERDKMASVITTFLKIFEEVIK